MTSQDMNTLTLLLDKHFAQTQAQIATMQKENAEFREQIRQDMNSFKTEIREDIKSFKSEVNLKLDNIQAEIVVLQKDVVGLQHDVAGLYHWDYWLLSIILIFFALPQIVSGVTALFAAITHGIAGIIALFRKEEQSNQKGDSYE